MKVAIFHIITKVIICSFCVFVSAGTITYARELVFKSGEWSVFKVKDVLAPDGSIALPLACSAETRVKNGVLSIARSSEWQIISISSSAWNFRNKIAYVAMVSDDKTLNGVFGGARYKGEYIVQMAPSPQGIWAMWKSLFGPDVESGYISIVNDKEVVIARFSARGFVRANEKAIECATSLRRN